MGVWEELGEEPSSWQGPGAESGPREPLHEEQVRAGRASAEAGGVRQRPGGGLGAGPPLPRGLVRLRTPWHLLRGSRSPGFLRLDAPRGLAPVRSVEQIQRVHEIG